jgi:putative pyrroloquinoline-quinone binding quinoprotein
VKCLECGAEPAEAQPFCGRCGAPTGMPAADPVPPRNRRPRIIAVAAVAAVGCLVIATIIISGRPSMSSRPRASARPVAPATSTATVRWTYDTGDGGEIRPAVAGGTVYVGSDDGTIYALDAATGRLRWTYTTGDSVGPSPAAAADTVYIGNDNGTVDALRAP